MIADLTRRLDVIGARLAKRMPLVLASRHRCEKRRSKSAASLPASLSPITPVASTRVSLPVPATMRSFTSPVTPSAVDDASSRSMKATKRLVALRMADTLTGAARQLGMMGVALRE